MKTLYTGVTSSQVVLVSLYLGLIAQEMFQ